MNRRQILGLAVVISLAWCSPISAQDPPAKDGKAASPFDDVKKAAEAAEHAGIAIKLAGPLPEGASLEDRLGAKGAFEGEGSLASFAEELGKALGAPVMLSVKKLEEASISPDTPGSCRLKNVKVKTGLRLFLGEFGLTYLTRDEVLVITTREDAGSQLVTRVYDCRDLMKLPSPVRKVRKAVPTPQGGAIGASGIPERPAEDKEVEPDGGYGMSDLIEVITSTVAPDSWEDVGGPGSLRDFKGFLPISQTEEVHDQIEQLLNMLHKAGELKEKVKVSR